VTIRGAQSKNLQPRRVAPARAEDIAVFEVPLEAFDPTE
jgi:hypothetical protein